ncbi:MAG: xylulokinase [Henriciella sp.]|nr:xylulokinase [Henriciella sp.]
MYLGLDIGTSGVKAILLSDHGEVAAQATAPLPISRPRSLWSEQNPADWWTATNSAVDRLPANLRSKVQAIGLAGQMHGATLLDEDDQPLRPAILWNDGRSEAECTTLEARVPNSREITGNIAMPGFTAPKLVWTANFEPEIFERTEKVLLPKDYVRFLMTGEFATDLSDAAGTLWLDVAKRDWSDDILRACHLSRDHMPSVFEGSQITGEVLASVAEAWKVPTGTPVIAGGGDNAAGAVGMGVFDPGDAFLSLGTSGVLFAADDAYRPNAESGVHTFCHAVSDRWHQMSVMLSAASCLDWASQFAGINDVGRLISEAEARGNIGKSETLFLPYLSGERTPHNNPRAKGVLFGLSHESDVGELGQAVLEGVALAFADGLDVLASSSDIASISVIGGGARSPYWGRILAAALNRPLVYRENAEVGPALGAARLAQMGVNGETQPSFKAPPIASEINPIADDVDRMKAKLDRFRSLYTSTKHLLQKDATNV